jgi:DNA-binding XRE family transcriptional regulator
MIDRKEFRKKRVNSCISQREFAKIAGLSYWTIVQFEKGRSIRKSSMHKIVQAMENIESLRKDENLWWKSHRDSLLKDI